MGDWPALLEDWIAQVSHQAYCAGWYAGIEELMWEFLQSGRPTEVGLLMLGEDDRADLAFLVERAQCWPSWQGNGVDRVPLARWSATRSGRTPR